MRKAGLELAEAVASERVCGRYEGVQGEAPGTEGAGFLREARPRASARAGFASSLLAPIRVR